MYVVTESDAKRLVTILDAIAEVEKVFASLERGQAEAFPVVLGHGSLAGTRFSMKGGLIRGDAIAGLKVGTYWPGNRDKGLESHGSTTLLLDDESGFPRALIAASYLTAIRTAAADGVAVKHLAKPDASILGIVGAGHQAWYELLAIKAVRPIAKVLVWSRTPANAELYARRARDELGLNAETCSLEDVSRGSDIIATVTTAHAALVEREWVRPGTHISAMGADSAGKQELDPSLVASGRLFADVVEQSVTIGEFETAYGSGLIRRDQISTIGSVIAGEQGRQNPDDITIFDSSGVAIQDLAIGAFALAKAIAGGHATELDMGGPN